jgi:hypothetical protein
MRPEGRFLCGKEVAYMTDTKAVSPENQLHIEKINGTTYELISNYKGKVALLDLLKQMLKRDLEKL